MAGASLAGDAVSSCGQGSISTSSVLLIVQTVVRSGRLDQLLADQVARVEVAVEGLTVEAIGALAMAARPKGRRGGSEVFALDDLEAANRFVDAVRGRGGRIVSFETQRKSLEELFVQTASAISGGGDG